ncbi:hypothetical protein F3D3_4450 [Fusibacter sp. 3D3]|nr:hypothetical protein F3D3_4450 [Fusibacter sp. 3D3]
MDTYYQNILNVATYILQNLLMRLKICAKLIKNSVIGGK